MGIALEEVRVVLGSVVSAYALGLDLGVLRPHGPMVESSIICLMGGRWARG